MCVCADVSDGPRVLGTATVNVLPAMDGEEKKHTHYSIFFSSSLLRFILRKYIYAFYATNCRYTVVDQQPPGMYPSHSMLTSLVMPPLNKGAGQPLSVVHFYGLTATGLGIARMSSMLNGSELTLEWSHGPLLNFGPSAIRPSV